MESQKLQHAMRDRLCTLGWSDIEVVDEDFGRSASGTVTRAGSGYAKGEGRLEKDPDLRVQERVSLVFSKFFEFGSARQTLLWFLEQGLQVPVSAPRDQVVWRRLRYTTIYKMLTNPAYAGAYAYAKTEHSCNTNRDNHRVGVGAKRRAVLGIDSRHS